jgi:hypothetical protein
MKFNKVTYHFDDWGVIFSLHEKSWTAQINHPGLCVGIFLAEYFSVVSAEVAEKILADSYKELCHDSGANDSASLNYRNPFNDKRSNEAIAYDCGYYSQTLYENWKVNAL